MIESHLSQWLQLWLDHFISPNKRLFWGYLITTLILAIWCFKHQKFTSESSFSRFLFQKNIWLHPSAKLDYQIWLINIAIKFAIIGPLLFSATKIGIQIYQSLNVTFEFELSRDVNMPVAIGLFTLFVFILDDFSRYLLHMLMHKIPFLWRFHKLHHSAEVMTPVTVYRTHPVESFLYASRLTLVNGATLGIGVFLFSNQLEIYQVAGANIAVFIFNLAGANLRHSHLWLSWGDKFEKWFISPAQHQIHHSTAIEHYDKNFGSAFAIWDRIFGSLVYASSIKQKINFGLVEKPQQNLVSAYFNPFKAKYRQRE